FETAGVFAFPSKFKGRLGATWSRSNISLSAIAYQIGGVRNAVTPAAPKGSAMTTLDLVLDYEADKNLFAGFGFNLSITNAFNELPPFFSPTLPYHVNYDSTNYSALGRVMSLSATKQF